MGLIIITNTTVVLQIKQEKRTKMDAYHSSE